MTTVPSQELVSKDLRMEGDKIVIEQVAKTVTVHEFDKSAENVMAARGEINGQIVKFVGMLPQIWRELKNVNKMFETFNEMIDLVGSDMEHIEPITLESVMDAMEEQYNEIKAV